MSLLDDFLTRDQLCAELHITSRTLARWQAQPDGIPVTKIGGRVLFRRNSVMDWLASHELHPNPRRRVA